MVDVYYMHFRKQLPEEEFNRFLNCVSDDIKLKVRRFYRWEDAYACLFGKLLLSYGLRRLGFTSFTYSDICFSEYGRPYLNESVDFNISHSGECVVCSISRETRVGVDVERNERIDVDDFQGQFHHEEWNAIRNSLDRHSVFYNYWTRKEAVIKWIGKGLQIPLNTLNVTNDQVAIGDKECRLMELSFLPGYTAHLAIESNGPGLPVVINEVAFINLLE